MLRRAYLASSSTSNHIPSTSEKLIQNAKRTTIRRWIPRATHTRTRSAWRSRPRSGKDAAAHPWSETANPALGQNKVMITRFVQFASRGFPATSCKMSSISTYVNRLKKNLTKPMKRPDARCFVIDLLVRIVTFLSGRRCPCQVSVVLALCSHPRRYALDSIPFASGRQREVEVVAIKKRRCA